MAKKQVSAPAAPAPANRPPYMLIEEIRVQGYKSLVDATLHVRPLTLLAGTNSSGKSSIMQPLLLIKQTMEAPYQPAGALLLSGGHVQIDQAEQVLSLITGVQEKTFSCFLVGHEFYDRDKEYVSSAFNLTFRKAAAGFEIDKQSWQTGDEKIEIWDGMSWEDVKNQLSKERLEELLADGTIDIDIFRLPGYLVLHLLDEEGQLVDVYSPASYEEEIPEIIHIPGLRSAPLRSYPYASYVRRIRGTFDLYAAGVVNRWQEQQDTEKLAKLNDYLRRLGLTDSVTAKVKNANEVELSVSRLPAGSKGKPRKADLVNIADVGIGVSQVLPILVALIAAQKGQLVYVEQPELHLHPRAQVAMAELLAEAANRGVRVIVETHSSLLLLTVQTLIAQDRIKNTDVALHWFARDAKGATQVTYVEPDEDGAYGAWPEDFGDVELRAQDAYLTAVGERHFGKAGK
ncbi:AAA family ATPase [Hymenobacter ruricola]|uniref:AAA family ATPase n=1 Tax=Hymenobacter ruricola TaxID=2791023 RepID=A0ABS0I1I0_9BACT|nr:AAA family ATPase [Hymenobacter ruricola]MBF9220775.1 AAA family ATPase [Hymenobacter ruricola]